MEKVSVAGGELVARLTNKSRGKLDYAAALASDNRAVALLPKSEYQSVFINLPAANLFLEQVFNANPTWCGSRLSREAPTPAPGADRRRLRFLFNRKAPNPLPAEGVW